MQDTSTYNPVTINDFDKTKLNSDGQGAAATIPAGTTVNIDYTLVDDCELTGAWFISNGGTFGDYCHFQIIDGSGAFTGTPGTLLNQFITNWYVPSETSEQFDIMYPAKILAGLTVRVIYHSTGTTDVFAAINYKLHKVLI
jgi:hypothetical protein